VLPARAGMIPITMSYLNPLDSAPRACGDDPVSFGQQPVHQMCSPRVRG